MSTLTALFVFGDEDADTEQLSTVWERFDDLSTGGEWTKHLHDPALEGFVVGDGPYDRNVRVGKDMIVGELYADGVNERTLAAPDLPFVELRIEEALFGRAEDEGDHEAHADALVDVLRETYFALDPRPTVVYAMPNLLRTAIADYRDNPPVTAASLQEARLEYPVWLTVFTPQLVETYGRETLLSAPAWQTYEWDDGSVVLVAYPDPELPQIMDEFEEHLGFEPTGL